MFNKAAGFLVIGALEEVAKHKEQKRITKGEHDLTRFSMRSGKSGHMIQFVFSNDSHAKLQMTWFEVNGIKVSKNSNTFQTGIETITLDAFRNEYIIRLNKANFDLYCKKNLETDISNFKDFKKEEIKAQQLANEKKSVNIFEGECSYHQLLLEFVNQYPELTAEKMKLGALGSASAFFQLLLYLGNKTWHDRWSIAAARACSFIEKSGGINALLEKLASEEPGLKTTLGILHAKVMINLYALHQDFDKEMNPEEIAALVRKTLFMTEIKFVKNGLTLKDLPAHFNPPAVKPYHDPLFFASQPPASPAPLDDAALSAQFNL